MAQAETVRRAARILVETGSLVAGVGVAKVVWEKRKKHLASRYRSFMQYPGLSLQAQ